MMLPYLGLYILGLLMFIFADITNVSHIDQVSFVSVIMLIGFTFLNTIILYLRSVVMYISSDLVELVTDTYMYIVGLAVGLVVSTMIYAFTAVYVSQQLPLYEYTYITVMTVIIAAHYVAFYLGMIILWVRVIPWARMYYGISRYIKNYRDKDAQDKEKSQD